MGERLSKAFVLLRFTERLVIMEETARMDAKVFTYDVAGWAYIYKFHGGSESEIAYKLLRAPRAAHIRCTCMFDHF